MRTLRQLGVALALSAFGCSAPQSREGRAPASSGGLEAPLAAGNPAEDRSEEAEPDASRATQGLPAATEPVLWTRPDGQQVELRRSVPGLGSCEGASANVTCECDDDMDCREREGGFCRRSPWRGGVAPPRNYIHQSCVYPACSSNADCPDGVCYPTHESTAAQCIVASCRSNEDCSRNGEAGVCRMLSGPGPGGVEAHCVFPGSACDPEGGRPCPSGERIDQQQVCAYRDGVAQCFGRVGAIP